MCFGPKSFLVVTDPVVAKHILKDNVKGYDKGALAVVLEDIMGQGLIPASPEVWAKRRRAITPGFHNLYLQRMVSEFGDANVRMIANLRRSSTQVSVASPRPPLPIVRPPLPTHVSARSPPAPPPPWYPLGPA